MKKIQLLNDYLRQTGFLPEESYNVWVEDGAVKDTMTAQVLNLDYRVYLQIDDYPFDGDHVLFVFFAIYSWLKLFEKPRTKNDRVIIDFSYDPKTSTTANIFFSFSLTESYRLNNDETITGCIDEYDDFQTEFDNLVIKIKRMGEEEQQIYP